MVKKTPRSRARAKVPDEENALYRLAEGILVILEPRLRSDNPRRHDPASETTWDLVLDLRDLVTRLEHRYPVLRLRTRRPDDGDPNRN